MGVRFATLILVGALGFLAVTDAFKDFLCSKDPTKKIFFPCTEDCQHQHGAFDGTCGDMDNGDYNCYCGAPNPVKYNASLHCQERKDNFRSVCTVDCLCNHGAHGGYCDWERKACICVGKNPRNLNCPTKTVPEFAKFVYDNVGEAGLGENGMKYVQPELDRLKEMQKQTPMRAYGYY